MDSTCSFVFKEHEFLSNYWREQLISDSETSRTMIDRVPTGAKEGGAFRQHIHQWSRPTSEQVGVCMVSHSNTRAVYRPCESGSIISIDFDCGLRNIERSTETHFALLLEQNNNIYISKTYVTAKRERWSTFSMHNLKRADFKRIAPKKESARDELPNFTFLGGDIRFGYATICTTSQTQDESVSGIDFWRVTVYHENAEATNQNMRVLQLEHNNNILLQELSDMHEHVDLIRREHSNQGLQSLQDELAQERERYANERAFNEQMRVELDETRAALQTSETNAKEAYLEGERLRIVVRDSNANAEAREAAYAARSEELVTLRDAEIVKLEQLQEESAAEIDSLREENAVLNTTCEEYERTVTNLREENGLLINEQQNLMQLNSSLSNLVSENKACTSKLEDLVRVEQLRCEDLERKLTTTSVDLKAELKLLQERMEDDIAREHSLRLQLENDHRKEMALLEERLRAEKSRMEEDIRAERLSYLKREAEMLEEKRNLATSLQAATTKGALIEQQLSNQLLSVSALHKSEVERIAQLEAALQIEREERLTLEKEISKEEDWEVVES